MTARTTRVRGMAAWQPRARSLALLNQVEAVLAEYRDHLPLTLRQIFYRLVGVYAYDKTEQAYKSLGELLNKGRRAGRIPFEVIRDDGVVFRSATGWQDVDHFLHELQDRVKDFWLDRQKNQPRRLLIVVEAAGMVPQIARVASTYGVGVMSTGGFDSTTSKYDLAQRLKRMTQASPRDG